MCRGKVYTGEGYEEDKKWKELTRNNVQEIHIGEYETNPKKFEVKSIKATE